MLDFVCDKCGKCCQNLGRSLLYSELDDGTGACKYYDHKTHLCTIYHERPAKCNIKEAYTYFRNQISYQDYLDENYKICKELKEEN